MRIRLQEKEVIKKNQKDQLKKIIEDILVGKKKKKDFVSNQNKKELLTKGEIIDLITKKNSPIGDNKVINSSSEQ
jgi:hypothetical protein